MPTKTRVNLCPHCGVKMEKVDGRKIGGIYGQKYYVCLPCGFLRPVKHRKSK